MNKKPTLLYYIFLSSVLFLSCKPIKKNTTNKKAEPSINYTSIDLYPVLPECSKIRPKLQKICFYQAISKRLQQNINTKKIWLSNKIRDSITVNFIIDTIGVASIYSIDYHDNSEKNKVLDSIIKISFKNLPKMKPAIKMGIPVKAKFTIPIIINTIKD